MTRSDSLEGLSALLRFNLRYYRHHRVLAMLCLTGIALGVGIVVAVELINGSALSSLASTVDFLAGRATHSVVSSYAHIDEKVFADIWTDPAVQAAAPILEVIAPTVETGDKPVRFLGIDPFLDGEFRNLGPRGQAGGSLLEFVAGEPPGVYVSVQLKERYGLVPGKILTALVAGVERKMRVLGTLPGRNEPNAARPGTPTDDRVGLGRSAVGARAQRDGATDYLAVVDISTAQELFGRLGRIDRIDLIVTGDPAQLAQRLPPGLRLTDRTERKSALEAMLYSFQLNLGAMSLLAVFVGVFLIYNFSMFSVLARREDMALLLTMGAHRDGLVAAFVCESLLLAAVGSLLGVGFGYLVALLGMERVSGTISELYFQVQVSGVPLTASILIRGFAVGFAATVAGTAFPVWEVAATPPILGMKRRTIEDRAHGMKGRLFVWGVFCLICSLAAAWASRFSVFWGFGSAFGVTLAFALLTPPLLSPLTLHVGRWLKAVVGSVSGYLAAATVRASLSRTSVAVAALASALAMTIGVDTMIHSFRESVGFWLDRALVGDLYISPDTTKWGHSLPDSLVGFLRRNPNVAHVERYSMQIVELRGRPVRLRIIDGGILRRFSSPVFLAGKDRAWDKLIAGQVFVSESLSVRFGMRPGDDVELQTPEGARRFTIAAVVRDYSSDQGTIHMDREIYERFWKDTRVQSVAMFLRPGASPEQVTRDVAREFPDLGKAIVSNARMRREVMVIFDKTFAPTANLKAVTLMVALLGVATALMAILMERARDLKVMGYLGLTPREMAKMYVFQGLIMGCAAFLIASVSGTVLTYVIVYAINYRSFGWSIDISLDFGIFFKILLLTVAVCLVSSIYPTYRLTRAVARPALDEE
ncbi:MAG: FtsX-like permease family protein [Thermodesulfobacteriota bacterium]